MSHAGDFKGPAIRLGRYAWAAAVIWIAIVAAFWAWNLHTRRQETLEVARGQARGAFEKDLVYRRWNAGHGGVYVPVTDQMQPNPYLADIPERDVVTTTGRTLTLVNPAYMTRQVHELGTKQYGLRGHITSLNLLRPENAPDAWETAALKAFERGETEVSSIEELDGEPYMRLMRPMITEELCLKCHWQQGYKVGDIRGGISVSTPMASLWRAERAAMIPITLGHGFLWLFGLGGLSVGTRSLKRRIRERKQAEQELRNSETRLSNAQRVAHMGSWDWNIVTNDLHWSDEVYRVFGLNPQEFGATYDAFLASVHPDDRESVQKHVKAAVHDNAEYSIDHRIVLSGGEVRYIHEQGEVTRDANGTPVHMIGTIIDITERKRAQELARRRQIELAHVARLSTMGEMATAIAHELNQPLTAILSSAQACSRMMRSETGGSDEILDGLEQVAAQAKRAGEIIRHLKDFSRRREPRCSTIDINSVVREAAGFLVAESGVNGVRMRLELADQLPAVLGDTIEVEQVIINLARNGFDAMDDTPENLRELTIQTSTTRNDAVEVAVCDMGRGLPAEPPGNAGQLFEPFYTTKAEGMGVGLSISRSIIESYGGRLWATRNPDRGATFRFTLPAVTSDERSVESDSSC